MLRLFVLTDDPESFLVTDCQVLDLLGYVTVYGYQSRYHTNCLDWFVFSLSCVSCFFGYLADRFGVLFEIDEHQIGGTTRQENDGASAEPSRRSNRSY